ncbi:hypothetical protein P3X46_033769, partial [Hevea brasiliensis]
MKAHGSILMKLLVALYLSLLCASQDFDFFYFVQQLLLPAIEKPAADFGIQRLWPNNYKDGNYPSNCDSGSPFNQNKISDLRSSMQKNRPTLACPRGNGVAFWLHEWDKHGTCFESVLDQHGYFKAALDLKKQVNLLQGLKNA